MISIVSKYIFFSGHTTITLDDARVFANHAKKKNIDVDDVKLAIQMHAEKMSSSGPPRDVGLIQYSFLVSLTKNYIEIICPIDTTGIGQKQKFYFVSTDKTTIRYQVASRSLLLNSAKL